MNYEQFLHYVRENIADKITDGENCRIFIQKVNKNNGWYAESLHIYRDGSKVSPLIELGPFYERYIDGEKMDDLLDEIAVLYEKNQTLNGVLCVPTKEFSSVCDRIVMRLVNYERNEVVLKDCPHVRVMDLAITFRWLAYQDEIGVSTALITNREMEHWGKDVEALYKLGMQNTPIFFPPKLQKMREVLKNYVDTTEDEMEIYILTNYMGIHGAVCILYESILEKLGEKIGEDFYILPSSIHEVILVPVSEYLRGEDLCQLVREANSSIVSEQEVLSDSVYLYKVHNHCLSIL